MSPTAGRRSSGSICRSAAPALPVLAVAGYRRVRVRDHLAVLEHIAARRHLGLSSAIARAVEGVAAPFAGGVRRRSLLIQMSSALAPT